MDKAERNMLDCSGLSLQALGERLRASQPGGILQLKSLDHRLSGVGAGLDREGTFRVDGSVGDFCFMLAMNSEWDVDGDAGAACAHSLVSCRVLIRKSAGRYLGAFATGGFIAVYGKAGAGCGYGLAGADVLVRSTVGDHAAAYMTDGVLILANGAGENLGEGMTGGTVYVRGEIQSLSDDVRPLRMKDTDSVRLSLLLARAGIKGDVSEFKIYRARKS